MIRTYIRERMSWFLLVLLLQSLLILIAYLDPEIPFTSILYINFLSTIIFIIFVLYRYNKETIYFKSLEDWEHSLDLTSIVDAKSPFEKIIENSVINQTERLKQEATSHSVMIEQEKDELLSWIHEIKTPLTAMHLMIDRIGDPSMKSQLTHEWLRIHLLLDQQLHQKRITFIENDLHIEKVNLKDLLFRELKTIQSWCIQKGIGFEVQLEEKEVLSDGKWLAYILRQLLTNAVKYSASSEIIIRSFQKNMQTILEVQDFGQGIAAKDIHRVFEKGFTSTAKYKDNTATGLGLYLANKAAQPLLIEINVKSTPGEGTTFSLHFPKTNEFLHITGM